MVLRLFSVCLLSLALFTGCMTRLNAEDPEATASVQKIVDTILSGKRTKVADMVSLPFWMDKWISDLETVRAEMGSNVDGPSVAKLQLRLYPIADLAVLKPRFWAQLQAADPAKLQDLVLGAMAVELDGKTESGFVLLRRVDGEWRLAGIFEE